MILILFNSYLLITFLQLLSNLDTKNPHQVHFEQIQTFVLPKVNRVKVMAKSPLFRKHFNKTLKVVFFSLTSLYVARRTVKFDLILYKLYKEKQLIQLDSLSELLKDLLVQLANSLADEMMEFLKINNLRDRLTRSQWVDFFIEMILDSGQAIQSFQSLLLEMGQYAIKGKNLRLESLNTYTKCLMEIPTAKKLPPLENARFLRGLEKLDTKYWAYSYYELEEHLKVLLEMYD